MKTKEELNLLIQEIDELKSKLAELDETELLEVCGGIIERESQGQTWNSDVPTDAGDYKVGIDVDLNNKWKM